MNSNHNHPPIFDGHNDVLTRLWKKSPTQAPSLFLEGDGDGHLDLPRMRHGNFAGGFFAIWIPNDDANDFDFEDLQGQQYDLPLPPPVTHNDALAVALAQASILLQIERKSAGKVKICRRSAELQHSVDNGILATILHLEGAEPIDSDFSGLQVLHAAGLRSLGPVWSRPTRFGHGVPFRFPSSPDTGPGLSDDGKRLIRACNELKIMVDLSHLNEKGFRDVAKISDAPLVATHSNAHAISPASRNLTDWQLAAIAESNGMVGVNFATCFLRADGQMTKHTPIDDVLRQLDYLIERLGEDRVGFGSDFDGAIIPEDVGDATGLPKLRQAMVEHGFNANTMDKVCYRNWLALMSRTIG